MADTLTINVRDIRYSDTVHVRIPIINKTNPCFGYDATEDQIRQLMSIPNYEIRDAATGVIINGHNLQEYFPGGGGGEVTSYSSLTGKPAIDNHTLMSGNNASSNLGLQTKLTATQLTAVNSGITDSDVTQIQTNKNNILSVQENPIFDKTFDFNDFTSDDIYKTDGTYAQFSGWKSTDYIDCTAYQMIRYRGQSFYQGNVDIAYVSFHDSQYNMIACLKSSDAGSGVRGGFIYVPPNAKYVRVVAISTTNALLILGQRTKKLKICCVGDSLTLGIDYYNHVIDESYPAYLGKYLGCDIVNYGVSGTTSKSWWNDYRTTKQFDNTMDIVLLMFGTNGGLQTNTLATDVEPYNDYNDYADTSVGDYCKLIESIMANTDNHAQIILLTAPYSTYSASQEQLVIDSVDTIKAIAKRYQLPTIDVLNESGLGKYNGATFRPHDGCHFNAKGYHKLGTFIGSQIKSLLSQFDLWENYVDETV